MSIYIQETFDERRVESYIFKLIKDKLPEWKELTIFVKSISCATAFQERIAQEELPCLGVEVLTLASWTAQQWELCGDGRKIIDARSRLLFLASFTKAKGGTLRMYANAAKAGVGEKDCAEQSQLSSAERQILKTLDEYYEYIAKEAYIEQSHAFSYLAGHLPQYTETHHYIFLGFSELKPYELELCCSLALNHEVSFVLQKDETLAFSQVDLDVKILENEALEKGIAYKRSDLPELSDDEAVFVPERAKDLQDLLEVIFRNNAGVLKPSQGHSVQLCKASGPQAEADLLTQCVTYLFQKNNERIALVTPNVRDVWKKTVMSFSCNGVESHAQLSLPLLQKNTVQVFCSLLKALIEGEKCYREAEHFSKEKNLSAMSDYSLKYRAGQGGMSWWPPVVLTDFLLSPLSGLSQKQAWMVDVAIRSHRLMGFKECMKILCDENQTSSVCAKTLHLLNRGHCSDAVNALLAHLQSKLEGKMSDYGDSLELEEKENLCAFKRLALLTAQAEEFVLRQEGQTEELKSLDEKANKELLEDENAYKHLEKVMDLLDSLLETDKISLSLTCTPYADGAEKRTKAERVDKVVKEEEYGVKKGEVYFLSPDEAAQLSPCSFDALIYAGLDTKRSSIQMRKNASDILLHDALWVFPEDELAQARFQFQHIIGLPRNELILECWDKGENTEEAFPAAMLSELMACYGKEKWTEAREKVEDKSCCPESKSEMGVIIRDAQKEESREEIEIIRDSMRIQSSETGVDSGYFESFAQRESRVRPVGISCLMKSSFMDEKGRELPVFSASQIEAYLSCPRSWFCMRLGLEDKTAQFGAAEKGSFMHEVMERLFDKVRVVQNKEGELVCGSSRSLKDATTVLDEVFVECMAQHYDKSLKKRSRLVAHNRIEDYAFDQIYRTIKATLQYSSSRLSGFHPLFLEHKFGFDANKTVIFGKKYLPQGIALRGCIDRVDVDDEGNAVIIDYKSSSSDSQNLFAKPKSVDSSVPFVLPDQIQALLYAWVIRELHPELNIVGACYLAVTKEPKLSGVCDPLSCEGRAHARIFGTAKGSTTPARSDLLNKSITAEKAGAYYLALDDLALRSQLKPSDYEIFGEGGTKSLFDLLLDRTEELVCSRLKEVIEEGFIGACPHNERSCSYCPVLDCSQRRKS